jgi:hypothetical protein
MNGTVTDASDDVQFGCPDCVASMRLISITGGKQMHLKRHLAHYRDVSHLIIISCARAGAIDLEVPAELSDLHSTFPAPTVPRALAPSSPPAPSTGVFTLIRGFVNRAVALGRSAIAGNATASNTTLSVENATHESIGAATTSAAATAGVALESTVDADEDRAAELAEAQVTVDGGAGVRVVAPSASTAFKKGDPAPVLEAHFAHPPPASARSMPATVQFVSLRSSQLKGVGFPIDHAAVVWCHDLLQVVTRGMQVLSRTSADKPLVWAEVFPLQARENTTHSTASVGSYEQHYNYRKQARTNWAAAVKQERAYITNQLPWTHWTALPFDFVSTHLLKVAACYLLVCCLILAAPLLRTLTGNSDGLCGRAGCWDNMLPWNHLSVDIVHAVAFNAVKTSIPPTFWLHLFSAFYQLLAFLVVVRMAYDYLFGTFDAAAYAVYVHWAVAYFAALLLRGAFLVAVQSVQWFANLGRMLLRLTLRCKPVRGAYRKLSRAVHDFCATKLPIFAPYTNALTASVAPVAVVSLWATVLITARQHAARQQVQLDALTFGLCVLTVVAYATMCLGMVAALLAPTRVGEVRKSARRTSPYHVDVLLLYLPAPLVALPAAHHALRLLYGTGVAYPAAAQLFSVFHLDRALSILAMASIAAHVWTARLSR